MPGLPEGIKGLMEPVGKMVGTEGRQQAPCCCC